MSVTAAQGFTAAGVAAGLKSTGKPDVSLVVNTGPEKVAAGVFTTNRICAAPVLWSRQAIADGRLDAVILNSGGANACTGSPGFLDSHRTAEHVAAQLGLSAQDVAVCSTGLIGVRLPMENLLSGADAAVAGLADTDAAGLAAAQAIMTTDTVHKVAAASTTSGGVTVTVGGMAKGAGMLAPGMATMLVVITTDAVLDAASAQEALGRATRHSFERVDSDGCMSTNDTVILLANGASGATLASEEFQALLDTVCASLARQLVADAEGASHDIAVTVTRANSEAGAEAVARAITRSNLFKAAVFGNDPNWGRVLAAAGTVPESVAEFDPTTIDVSINGIMVCRGGGVGEDRDLVDMTPRETRVLVDLKSGDHEVTVWTNDLTHDYVEENSAYSS
ncbi:bifunctional glutamate N-acetyltransferase/amino-acid acetyltransferase ArgJ [Micrococcales bacterium 31B]|nr:bifunctional glutamate N-acetyltransferase/amino-acid acetyltransferase ArgJ [Micrococcales bacterium 31B]